MIRILVVDDLPNPEFIESMRREASGSNGGVDVDARHINPVDLMAVADDADAKEVLLDKIGEIAEEFWDVVIIDVNLADVHLPNEQKLHLSLLIAERVREVNHSTIVILYSGTLKDHVSKLLGVDNTESSLKRIYRSGIASFVPRNRISSEVLSALDNPSWLLRIERLLLRHSSLTIVPEDVAFGGRSFSDLAGAIRRQTTEGQRLAEMIVELGISNLVSLNA